MVHNSTHLRASQRELMECLAKGMGAAEIAAQLGITKAAMYQRIQPLISRGLVIRIGFARFSVVEAPKHKPGAPAHVNETIRSVVLPVTHTTEEGAEQRFYSQVETALARLDNALSAGFQVITQQLFNTTTGQQIVYILHQRPNAVGDGKHG